MRESTPESQEKEAPDIDPTSLSVRQKIAQFRRSTKGMKSDNDGQVGICLMIVYLIVFRKFHCNNQEAETIKIN